MESLPVDQTAIGFEKKNSTSDDSCEKLAINGNSNSNSSSSSSSGSSRNSRDDIKSAIGTNPGDDCSLSDGEVRDDVNLRSKQESKKAIKIFEKNPTMKIKNKSEKRSHDDEDKNEDHDDVSDQNREIKVCGFTRYEASKYYIKVTSVLEGGQEDLISTETALLSSLTDATATDKLMKSSNNNYADIQNSSNNNNNNNKESKSVTDDFSIGRSRCNNYPLDDLSVSKKHAIISYYQGVGFILRDLKSKHGTFLDDVRLGIPDPKSSASNIRDDKEGSETTILRGCEVVTAKGCGNKGFLLQDGSIVRFGRVICMVFRKRQSAVISSG